MFRGKPRRNHLLPIVDRIKTKLASWKGSLLSIMGRVQLVKSIILSMLVYSFHIYAWPMNLLNLLDRWIRNFIWARDIYTKKVVTVAWHRVCKPVAEGGLGIRNIKSINRAGRLKLSWEFMGSDSQWCHVLKARALRNDHPVRHHITSSIWAGIRDNLELIKTNSSWQIGNGTMVNFWNDTWLSRPITELIGIPSTSELKATVSDFMVNGSWCIPQLLTGLFLTLKDEIQQVVIPNFPAKDQLRWSSSSTGLLSFKDAFYFLSPVGPQVPWCKLLWNSCIPPSKSFILWRIMHHKMPTDENLWIRGCVVVSVCSLCGRAAESTCHLFLDCCFARRLWHSFGSMINSNINLSSFHSVLSLATRGWSSQMHDVVIASIINILWGIWHCRNQVRFQNKIINSFQAINLISANLSLSSNASTGFMSSSAMDLVIMRSLGISGHPPKAPNIKQVTWHPPICS